jgi:dephospho-CoA kinase
MNIIGITGTLGAGKGTIVDFLVNNKGYKHFSVRNFLIEEIKRRNLPINRDSMANVANDLRAKHTPYFVVEKLFELAVKNNENAIIESIRTPGEVDYLKTQGDFYLIAVDADPKTRYNRIILRASETDRISYETFISNEQRELTTDDPNKQNLKKCIQMADILLNNDGSIDELNESLKSELAKLH